MDRPDSAQIFRVRYLRCDKVMAFGKDARVVGADWVPACRDRRGAADQGGAAAPGQEAAAAGAPERRPAPPGVAAEADRREGRERGRALPEPACTPALHVSGCTTKGTPLLCAGGHLQQAGGLARRTPSRLALSEERDRLQKFAQTGICAPTRVCARHQAGSTELGDRDCLVTCRGCSHMSKQGKGRLFLRTAEISMKVSPKISSALRGQLAPQQSRVFRCAFILMIVRGQSRTAYLGQHFWKWNVPMQSAP